MCYLIGSRSYLTRAQRCLDKGTNEYLFYAALNLRCGIESRLREYLAVQPHIPNKYRNDWDLSSLGRTALKYFSFDDQVQVISISSGSHSREFKYIPVSTSLLGNGKKLGNYLHDMKKFQPDDSKWWLNFTDVLNESIVDLTIACSGDLLGPALTHKQDEKRFMNIKAELFENEDIEWVSFTSKHIIQVDYVAYIDFVAGISSVRQ